MSYIKKVIIENFQSHEYTLMEFSQGLNVIVGPSDQGKSAIVRAIKWVIFNEPRGMDFIRVGTSSARVTVELSNNYSIIRERSRSKNRYQVVNPSGNVDTFEGFGNDVPKEVLDAHGIKKLSLERGILTSLNIAEQLEGPFLLSESGSTRAKAIGRLVGVHILDRALRECAVDLRRENQAAERIRVESQEIEERLQAFQDLNEIERRLSRTEEILRSLDIAANKRKILNQWVERLERFKKEEVELIQLLRQQEPIEEMEGLIFTCSNRMEKWREIDGLGKKLKLVNDEIFLNEYEIDITKHTMDSEDLIRVIRKVKDRLDTIHREAYKLHDINRSIIKEETDLQKYGDETDSLIQQYSNLLKQLGVCPLCKSDIRNKDIEEIIQHSMEEI